MTVQRVATAVGAAGLVLVLALSGCARHSVLANGPHTGAATASAVDGVQQITVIVDDKYRFDPSTITVHPGQVKVTLVHQGTGAPHDLQVVGFPGDQVPLTAHGQTSSSTFTAPSPGSYQFICSIHVNQGQTGTLVVLAS